MAICRNPNLLQTFTNGCVLLALEKANVVTFSELADFRICFQNSVVRFSIVRRSHPSSIRGSLEHSSREVEMVYGMGAIELICLGLAACAVLAIVTVAVIRMVRSKK